MVRREAIDNPRVPIVEDGSKVNEEDHRRAGVLRSEFAVGELHATCGDRPRRNVLPGNFRSLRRTHAALLLRVFQSGRATHSAQRSGGR
jgi:hypothetical protein